MASPLRALAPADDRRQRRADVLARAGRPALVVVTPRRRVAAFAVTTMVLVAAAMAGVIFLSTLVAERQLEIDRLERGVRTAQEEYDVLRASRAELRSPTRLSAEAAALGMVPGSESEFVTVDPMTLAVAIARSGVVPNGTELVTGPTVRLEPLDQFRLVKQVAAEAP